MACGKKRLHFLNNMRLKVSRFCRFITSHCAIYQPPGQLIPSIPEHCRNLRGRKARLHRQVVRAKVNDEAVELNPIVGMLSSVGCVPLERGATFISRYEKGSEVSAHDDRTVPQRLEKPVDAERRVHAPLIVVVRKLASQAPVDDTENSLNHHSVNQNNLLYGKCSSVREQMYRTSLLIFPANEAISQPRSLHSVSSPIERLVCVNDMMLNQRLAVLRLCCFA